MPFCGECGAERPAGQTFCGDCGAAAGGGSAAPLAPVAPLAEEAPSGTSDPWGWYVGIVKLWTARSRLYNRRFLQASIHYSAFFEIYKILRIVAQLNL